MSVIYVTTVCWLADNGAYCSLFSAVRQLPAKPKEVANMDKKLELEKRLESVQNVLGTSQTAKKLKPGKFSCYVAEY